MKVYIDTIQKAEKVRELYREGFSHQKVQEMEKISRQTYYRYWEILGGRTQKDEITHYRNQKPVSFGTIEKKLWKGEK